MWERSRLEWWIGDPGDPAEVAARFLERYDLGVPDGQDHDSAHGQREICGASLLISASAGAVMAGGPPGRPSPCAAVPDLAIVVYAHESPRSRQLATSSRLAEPWVRQDAGSCHDLGTGEWAVGEWAVGEWAVGEWAVGEWEPSWTPAEHATAVELVRQAIARGDVYQVNVVGHAAAPYHGDPVPALRRVAGLPGALYGGILTGADWAIASASPELLVRVSGGVVETRPIKGTRPATRAGRKGLRASPKERAEHVMIVDLERNDLAQMAQIGTVEVPELFVVRRWCDLWQAESSVTARLAGGLGLADLLRALCPGGSVTGAPKLAALSQIAALEPVGRGPSMGALGWLDEHRLELGLTIRTVATDGQRVHLWAGGGITWDSDPAAEVAEAHAKAAPLQRALAG